jgi:tetratricopeptide (TPR) repeat protein
MAPDVTVPDRAGRPVHLARLRGKKVLVDTRHAVSTAFHLINEEFARRVKPRSAAELEAEAAFKLAVWFHQEGRPELAAKYFERAQALNPDDWNYHRQEWSFTPREAGKKWLEKFQKQIEPYYPKLELKPKGG